MKPVVAVLLTLVGACGTTPPPTPTTVAAAPTPADATVPGEVVLRPVEEARAIQVASLVMASPIAIGGELDSLSKHLSLPVPLGQELFARLSAIPGGGTKVADLAKKLDVNAPISVVWFMGKSQATQGFCAAMTLGEGVEGKAAEAEFGVEKSREGGVSERLDSTGTTLFLAPKGRALLVANRREILVLGGALALASQIRRSNEQVAVSVWPNSLAQASGRGFDQLANQVSKMIETLPTPTGGQLTSAGRKMLAAGVNLLFGYMGQTQLIRFVFGAGTQRGLVLRMELTPKPNTALALLSATTAPYSLDPGLPIKNDGNSVFAWGDIWNWLADVQKVFQATGKAGEKMAAEWRKLYGETVSSASCSLDFASSNWLLLCSYDVRKGVDAVKSLDSFVAMYEAQNQWTAELEGRKATPLKIKKGKGTVSIEQKVESADKKAMALMKSLYGSDQLRIAFATANGKVIQSFSAKPIDPISVYGKPASTLPRILAASLSQAKGAEMMASIEPVAPLLYLLPKVAGNEMAPFIGMLSVLPGGADLHVPMVLTMRAGEVLSGELQFPIGGLETLGKVLGGVMGQPAR